MGSDCVDEGVGCCCTQGKREKVKAVIHLRVRQKEGARYTFVEKERALSISNELRLSGLWFIRKRN